MPTPKRKPSNILFIRDVPAAVMRAVDAELKRLKKADDMHRRTSRGTVALHYLTAGLNALRRAAGQTAEGDASATPTTEEK